MDIAALQIDQIDSDLLVGTWWNGRYFKSVDGYLHRRIAIRMFGHIRRGMVVDHVNRDSRDNRRANLRVVTQSENVRNSNGKANFRRSKYRGVFPARGRWSAQITVNKIRKCLGTFDSEESAAQAYHLAELRLVGGLAGKP